MDWYSQWLVDHGYAEFPGNFHAVMRADDEEEDGEFCRFRSNGPCSNIVQSINPPRDHRLSWSQWAADVVGEDLVCEGDTAMHVQGYGSGWGI